MRGVILICLAVHVAVAGATSPFDYLGSDVFEVPRETRLAFLKTLLVGLDRLTPDERARLATETAADGWTHVVLDPERQWHVEIDEPPTNQPFAARSGEENRRGQMAGGLVLSLAIDWSSHALPYDQSGLNELPRLLDAAPAERLVGDFKFGNAPATLLRLGLQRPARASLPLLERVLRLDDARNYFWASYGQKNAEPLDAVKRTLGFLANARDERQVYDVLLILIASVLRQPGWTSDANQKYGDRAVLVGFAPLVRRLHVSRALALGPRAAGQPAHAELTTDLGPAVERLLAALDRVEDDRKIAPELIRDAARDADEVRAIISGSAYFKMLVLCEGALAGT